MAEEVEKELNELVNKTAKKLSYQNYSSDLNIESLKGDGYMSELFLLKITNEDQKYVNIAIKKAFKNENKRREFTTAAAFKNEIAFYSKVFPKLDAFQKEKHVKEPFDCVPEFYAALEEEGSESIAMENIKLEGYDTLPKELLFTQEQMEFILKQYGKFHALSTAFKQEYPEEYQKLAESISPVLKNPITKGKFFKLLAGSCKSAFEELQDSIDLDKYKQYWENDTIAPLDEIVELEKKFSCFLHGDCWSNNLMLKMEENRIIALKMIDFQITCDENPCLDLTYMFYSGGTGEMFQNYNHYLQVYHKSFSDFLKELKCELVYSLEDLQNDWKKFARYGIALAFLLAKIKLSTKEGTDKMVNDEHVKLDALGKMSCDTDLYSKRVKDLIFHAINNNFL